MAIGSWQRSFCERDGSVNPLLWLCGAKAITKIGSAQPDQAKRQYLLKIDEIECENSNKLDGAGLAQKKIGKFIAKKNLPSGKT